MNLNKKQALVYKVIQLNPGVQNSDNDLIAAVWRYEGWNDQLSLEENLRRVTRPETITRRRRDLHTMGLIEYSKEADKQRMEAFESEREASSDYNFAEVLAVSPPPPPSYQQLPMFNLKEK